MEDRTSEEMFDYRIIYGSNSTIKGNGNLERVENGRVGRD